MTDGARRPHHCRAQGSTDGTKMLGHRQCLPSEEEEERASHPPGKMRSVPKGLTTNGRGPFATGAYNDKGLAGDGGGRRQEEGGVNTTISQKRDALGAGHRSAKTATAVRAVAAATAEARAIAAA